MNQLFLIAEVNAAYGSEGYVFAESFSDFSGRFKRLKRVYIEFFGNLKEFAVEDVREIRGKVCLKIRGFDSAEDAKLLIGKKLYVDESNSVKLEKDTFFIHDLIGSSVFRGNILLGIIEDVYVLPANDVFVIKSENGKRILVPAVKDFVKDFDPVKKRLDLHPMCDLLYDED